VVEVSVAVVEYGVGGGVDEVEGVEGFEDYDEGGGGDDGCGGEDLGLVEFAVYE